MAQRATHSLVAGAVALVATLAPRLALACPYCTTNLDRLSSTLRLVGAFLTVPFLITGIVIWVIRNVSAEDAAQHTPRLVTPAPRPAPNTRS